jgi:phospholipase D1/2
VNSLENTQVRSNGAPDGAAAPRKKRKVVLLLPLIPLLAIAAIWYFADLSSLKSPERVAETARALRESPLGFVYVLIAFAAGTLLFFPVTALILGTTLAFDALRGFSYAFAGALLGTSITYWVGRMLGSSALDYVSGPKIAKLSEQLRTHAFRASIAARLMPVGNFTAINLLAGSLRIPFAAFFLGNIVGIFPGVLILTLFSDRISEVLSAPNKTNLFLLGGAGLVVLGLMFVVRRWSKQRERSAGASEGTPS